MFLMFAVRQIRSQRFARRAAVLTTPHAFRIPNLFRLSEAPLQVLCYTPLWFHSGDGLCWPPWPTDKAWCVSNRRECLAPRHSEMFDIIWILRQFASMLMPGICGIVVCGPQVQGVAEAMKTAPRLARTFPFSAFHRFSVRRFSRATFNY